MYHRISVLLVVLFVKTQQLISQPPPVVPQLPQCMCIEAQKGQPLVQNAQSIDKQNIGDQCLPQPDCDLNYSYRYIDGRCNNVQHKTWGMPNNTQIRLLPASYSTAPGDPPGSIRRSAVDNKSSLQSTRVISRDFFTDHDFPSPTTTLIFMVMSQLFTHDVLSLKLRNAPPTGCCVNGTARVPPEKWDPGCLSIDIPTEDRFYKEFGIVCSQILRAQFSSDAGCKLPEIEQINTVTSFFDGSVVYGNTKDIADLLRLMQDGKLKFETTEDGRVWLPHMDQANTFCFAETNKGKCFEGSDFRANQHPQLSAIQVMLLRVHNKLADELKKINSKCPEWQNDEILYQETKKLLTAILQYSIFGRFSEILFGPDCADAYGFSERQVQGYYSGYDPELNPGTLAEFEHVAFRAFHTLVKGDVGLYDESRKRIGEFVFSDWFNNPTFIKQPGIFDQLLIGMCTEPMEMFDRFFTSEITDKLFKQINQGKFGGDLAATDLIRGRECGMQTYVEFAKLAGFPDVQDFNGLADRMDPKMIERLQMAYKSVKDIDPLMGVVLENPYGESILGKTLHVVIAEQFRRYKFGDSHYFSFEGKGQFTPGQLAAIRTSSLAFLVCYGSDGIQRMQMDAYTIPQQNQFVECKQIVDEFLKQLWANWASCPPNNIKV